LATAVATQPPKRILKPTWSSPRTTSGSERDLSKPLHPVAYASPIRAIQFTATKLAGCFVVQFPAFPDSRGFFVKAFQKSLFEAQGLEADFAEVFYTTSHKRVLRGMHFQVPPSDHAKLVYCTSGSICDMALDLRVGSPSFGQHEVYELSERFNNAVFLPRGIAHGFYVREAPSVVVYHVTTEHNPAHDQGILWSSFGAPWPDSNPVVSARDAAFPALDGFRSPFRYVPNRPIHAHTPPTPDSEGHAP